MTENQNRTVRLHLMLTPEEEAAVKDWRFSNRIESKSEAVRLLLHYGLKSVARPIDVDQDARIHTLAVDMVLAHLDEIEGVLVGNQSASAKTKRAAIQDLLMSIDW